MSVKLLVEGHVARKPELRYTNTQIAVTTVDVGCTKRVYNEQSAQWENKGAPLFVKATFWKEQAERLSAQLDKGDKVVMTGDLVRREYQRNDGTQGSDLVLDAARLLCCQTKNAPAGQDQNGWGQGQGQGQSQSGQGAWGQGPAKDDPWATNQPPQQQGGTQDTFDTNPPF